MISDISHTNDWVSIQTVATYMEQKGLVKILDSVSPDVNGDGQMSEGACVIISSSTKCVEQTASVDIQDLISPNTNPKHSLNILEQ